MTAPSAPIIRVHSDGSKLRVGWLPVYGATDYKLYVGDTADPSGVEADIADDEVGDDGWFQYTFIPLDVDSYVHLTALNELAEESDASNEVFIGVYGPGTSFGTRADPFSNDR